MPGWRASPRAWNASCATLRAERAGSWRCAGRIGFWHSSLLACAQLAGSATAQEGQPLYVREALRIADAGGRIEGARGRARAAGRGRANIRWCSSITARRAMHADRARHDAVRVAAADDGVCPARLGRGGRHAARLRGFRRRLRRDRGLVPEPRLRRVRDGRRPRICAPPSSICRSRPDIDATRIISVGQSAGGFATVALTADPPAGLVAAISFAGGRGSPRDGEVCADERLVAAFARVRQDLARADAVGLRGQRPVLRAGARAAHAPGLHGCRRQRRAHQAPGVRQGRACAVRARHSPCGRRTSMRS